MINVLVACEESQRVCYAFRSRGFNAFSCDLQKCTGGLPCFHICDDVLPLIKSDHPIFFTQDGMLHTVDHWDLLIAHPPCTYLSAVTAPLVYSSCGINEDRMEKLKQAADFFYELYNCDIPHICIENPRPLRIAKLPPVSQMIEPYFFGEPYSKRTYLWLKGLPPLFSTEIVEPKYSYTATVYGSKLRSKTFKGIASAMADQWGDFL